MTLKQLNLVLGKKQEVSQEVLGKLNKAKWIIVEHELLDMMESAVKTLQHALSCIFYCGPYHETNKTSYYYYYGEVGSSWLTFPTNLLKTLKIYRLDKCHCWKNKPRSSNFTRNLLTYFLVFTKNSWFNREVPGLTEIRP